MEFDFSEDQLAIATLAESIFRDHGSDERTAKLYAVDEPFDAQLWQSLAEAGFLAAILPTACGGSGLGMLDFGLLLERQGATVSPVPLWRHSLASLAVATFGSQSLQDRYLARLVDGSAIASMSTEPDSWSSVYATPQGNGWAISGMAATVTMNRGTALVVIPAQLPGGTTGMFVVPTDHPAITMEFGVSTNYESVADLSFDTLELSGDALLECDDPISWITPRASLAVAALQLGVTAEALTRTAAYVGEREQFGRAIGSFQAVAMRMADAYVQLELLRTAQWQLAWRLDQNLPSDVAGWLAKYQAGQAGHIIGHTAQHYHGGVGADTTYPIHRFFLWSKALDLAGGGSDWQIEAIAGALPGDVGFSESVSA